MERERKSELVGVQPYELTLEGLEDKIEQAPGDYLKGSDFKALLG